jgi:hypothetical protein
MINHILEKRTRLELLSQMRPKPRWMMLGQVRENYDKGEMFKLGLDRVHNLELTLPLLPCWQQAARVAGFSLDNIHGNMPGVSFTNSELSSLDKKGEYIFLIPPYPLVGDDDERV